MTLLYNNEGADELFSFFMIVGFFFHDSFWKYFGCIFLKWSAHFIFHFFCCIVLSLSLSHFNLWSQFLLYKSHDFLLWHASLASHDIYIYGKNNSDWFIFANFWSIFDLWLFSLAWFIPPLICTYQNTMYRFKYLNSIVVKYFDYRTVLLELYRCCGWTW